MEIKKVTTKEEWEKGLEHFEYTTMFDSWEWAQFEKSLKKEFYTFGLYEDNKILGLLPIKVVLAKRGKYLHLRHGPLINWQNSEQVHYVLEFLKEFGKREKVHFIRISPLLDKSKEGDLKRLDLEKTYTHANDAELSVYLDLTKSEESILMSMRKNTRNLIRKAEKLGVYVKSSENFELWDDFVIAYEDTVKRHNWNAYSLEYIKKEYEVFLNAGNARMFVTYYKDKPISASIFIVHRNQVIYHHSGSLSEFKNLPASYLLHWEAIKYFKNMGLQIYNFWGVSPDGDVKHPWYGLSLFKRGFTKDVREFVHAHDLVLHPFAYLTRWYEFFEAKQRGYR